VGFRGEALQDEYGTHGSVERATGSIVRDRRVR
jgi:hypothetical protein